MNGLNHRQIKDEVLGDLERMFEQLKLCYDHLDEELEKRDNFDDSKSTSK